MDLLGRARRCHDYIRALEEERKKIEVFQRELPLCLQLVTQAIESVRHRAGEEEGVNEGLVLEEFIPLKPSPSSTLSEEEKGETRKSAAAIGGDRKPEWLRSVQLWNQEPDTDLKVEPPKKPIAVSLKKIGGAFQPFDREKHVAPPAVAVAPPASSTAVGGDGKGGIGGVGGGCADVDGSRSGGRDKEKEGQSQPHRKARRCWSPELHRRFLHALQQLGGSHVATPKQIRELMKVDGLTNDEVKSHLQKYRLHTRRLTPMVQSSSSSTSSPPATQFVLVGGILVSPPDYAAATPGNGACAPPDSIYAPVALIPSGLKLRNQQPHQQSQRSIARPSDTEGRSGGEDDNSMRDDGDATNSVSPTTSATSQTTTASPLF
ncbi:MYB family transcription factor [Musa troglodytarum]|uniref:MYB family transcription factor n=1 Tax=Musa troglodytarum TaxID=320322 RepID=A0A9E7H237_9LILI|nr:MYB family transcription factor [Musa troglodytarum]